MPVSQTPGSHVVILPNLKECTVRINFGGDYPPGSANRGVVNTDKCV
jgi:hypothetical protein